MSLSYFHHGFNYNDFIRRKTNFNNYCFNQLSNYFFEFLKRDIRGAGLRKLDDEEAALFDKQKEENEKMKEADNKIKNVLPTTTTKNKERLVRL